MFATSVRRRLFPVIFTCVSVVALGLTSSANAPAAAQGVEGGHPAHIHVGTCEALGEVAWPLSNVGPGTIRNGKPSINGKPVGQEVNIYPVDVSVTRLDVPLTTITDGSHAINIHESADNIQAYIACGNIGGTQYGNTLIIGVGQLNSTGYTGIAVLRADEQETVVTVYLEDDQKAILEDTVPANDEEEGSDDGSSSDDADGEEVPEDAAVSIADFAFDSDNLEIPAGTTVTWTNDDGAPHTVTSDDGEFDSGRIESGDTYSYTFDEPGTYTYHCDFHGSMTATIVVT